MSDLVDAVAGSLYAARIKTCTPIGVSGYIGTGNVHKFKILTFPHEYRKIINNETYWMVKVQNSSTFGCSILSFTTETLNTMWITHPEILNFNTHQLGEYRKSIINYTPFFDSITEYQHWVAKFNVYFNGVYHLYF